MKKPRNCGACWKEPPKDGILYEYLSENGVVLYCLPCWQICEIWSRIYELQEHLGLPKRGADEPNKNDEENS